MMGHYQEFALQRSVSCRNNYSRKISPASGFYSRSPSSLSASAGIIPSIPEHEEFSDFRLLVPCRRCSSVSLSDAGISASSSSSPILQTLGKLFHFKFSSLLRSLMMNVINIPNCKFLSLPSLPSSGQLISLATGGYSRGRRLTGTLYGHRLGHVTFAVQNEPRSDPVLLLDLAMSTATFVKEMSSGLVRIVLECEKRPTKMDRRPVKLFQEPVWTMYCNGKKCGYTLSRGARNDSDWRVLDTVSRVSVGAGVIPTNKIYDGGVAELGEQLYMRGRFERVIGSRDSEAFYMLNPDKNGGAELSIFLLRI